MRSGDKQQKRNGDSSFANSVLFGTYGTDNNQSPNNSGFSGGSPYNRSTLTSTSPGFGNMGGIGNQSFSSSSHGNGLSPASRNHQLVTTVSASRFPSEHGSLHSANKSRISRSAHKPPLSSLSEVDSSSQRVQSSVGDSATYPVRSSEGFGHSSSLGGEGGFSPSSSTPGMHSQSGYPTPSGGGIQRRPPLFSTAVPDAERDEDQDRYSIIQSGAQPSASSSSSVYADRDQYRGANGSSAPLIPGADTLEAAWRAWVVVFGYQSMGQSPQHNVHNMLLKFQQYGEVLSYYCCPGGGNWMLLKYESPIQAERATAQHCSFLSEHPSSDPSSSSYHPAGRNSTLIAVVRMDCRLAKYLSMSLGGDGRLVSLVGSGLETGISSDSSSSSSSSGIGSGSGSREGLFQRKAPSSSQAPGERAEQLYLRPYRRKDICSKLMEYFFQY
jgi:hypothetical protein